MWLKLLPLLGKSASAGSNMTRRMDPKTAQEAAALGSTEKLILSGFIVPLPGWFSITAASREKGHLSPEAGASRDSEPVSPMEFC